MIVKLIGIAGYARHGKDFTADQLEAELMDKGNAFKVLRYAFADELRKECESLILPYYSNYKEDLEKEDVRQIHIAWGFIQRKYAGINYWIDKVHAKIKRDLKEVHKEFDKSNTKLPKGIVYVLITDVRAENEVKYIKSKGNGLFAKSWLIGIRKNKLTSKERFKLLFNLVPPVEKTLKYNFKKMDKVFVNDLTSAYRLKLLDWVHEIK